MPLIEKQRQVKDPRRPGYAVFKRKRRTGFFVFVLLAALVLGSLAYLFPSVPEETRDVPSEQADTPIVEQEAPKDTVAEDTTASKEETGRPAPTDPTLYLTVPKLGLYDNTVRNDRSESALGLGAIKLPSTGFPWEKGANTYIACHRLGFPGTQSHNQCLDLPSMQKGDKVTLKDANGAAYEYQVSEILVVSPNDTWVTEPVAGREMVSLQTCVENANDYWTLGPNWLERIVVRADRVG
jgi:sortase A